MHWNKQHNQSLIWRGVTSGLIIFTIYIKFTFPTFLMLGKDKLLDKLIKWSTYKLIRWTQSFRLHLRVFHFRATRCLWWSFCLAHMGCFFRWLKSKVLESCNEIWKLHWNSHGALKLIMWKRKLSLRHNMIMTYNISLNDPKLSKKVIYNNL